MALMKLRDNFGAKATATGLAAALLVLPSIANSQDAQPQQQAEFTQASTNVTNVSLSNDAGRAAGEWSRSNSGISVAVYLGTESRVSPDQIEQILTREIRSAGVNNVAFFYEQNNVPGTGVIYAYAGDFDGPFNLAEARPAAVEAARQYRYQQDIALNLRR